MTHAQIVSKLERGLPVSQKVINTCIDQLIIDVKGKLMTCKKSGGKKPPKK